MTTTNRTTNKIEIPDRLYFRIGDVANLVGVRPYVLRYWESEFAMIHPQKSPSGQRVYRRTDVETVVLIKHLLYDERYSIEGARKRLKELRREGQLKEVKEEVIGASDEKSGADLKRLALELKSLAETPISDLFLD